MRNVQKSIHHGLIDETDSFGIESQFTEPLTSPHLMTTVFNCLCLSSFITFSLFHKALALIIFHSYAFFCLPNIECIWMRIVRHQDPMLYQ